jgi:crotonobetainyl-CoA:carnitine CoA-transferase CaiB-like acyl-CoA transferase
MSRKPLVGVRVLDLSNVVAGPLCSYQLALLGADVVKVETPGTGDLSRKMGADPELSKDKMGVSFLALNAGKRSIVLNLKSDAGKAVFLKLVEEADVVLENFRPGTMARLGLDYKTLAQRKPSLIYCAVSGFGQSGPLAHRPSYDQIIQGFCGLMDLTGDKDTAPIRAGYVVCDTMAATTASFAISAALYRRAVSGEGEFIDLSMLEASLATMASWPATNYLNAGEEARPLGNQSHIAAPSGTFRTGDGSINIVNNEQHQFEKLCEATGLVKLKTDPRFAERDTRFRNREELTRILEAALAKHSAVEWDEILAAHGIPAGPILTLKQVLRHPQLKARDFLYTLHDEQGIKRDMELLGVGFLLSDTAPKAETPPPLLGADTDKILSRAGYRPEQIAELRANGAIG